MSFDVRCKKCDREFRALIWSEKFCPQCHKVRTADRVALFREAYMAALNGNSSINDMSESSCVQYSFTVALETVRQWDSYMEELGAG